MEAFSTQSLENLLLLCALGAFLGLFLARLRLPVVSGLLISGALLGPNGLGLVKDTELIQVLAKVGVVLLMFTVGLALSPRQLRLHARVMALGGLTQVGLTILTATLGAGALGLGLGQSLFIGFVVAQSSTAIVLRALSDRNELQAPHGRLITGALLVQDLTLVPMLVSLPVLAGGLASASPRQGLVAFAESLGILAVVWGAGRTLAPLYFRRVLRLEGYDVFLLSVLALLLGASWLSAKAGLSTALGAFLAGLLLADAKLGDAALKQVLPFREVSTALFFLSLGMLFNPAVLRDWHLFLGLLLAFTVGKAVLGALAARLMGFPLKVAALSGVGLGQFSEFGYVLLQGGLYYGLIRPDQASLLLSAGIVSMMITPLALRAVPRFLAGEKVLAPLERLLGLRGADRAHARITRTKPDVLLLGWGEESARLSARLARQGLRSLALDCDPGVVSQAQAEGYPVVYGDALSPEVLGHAGVAQVRGVVSLLPVPLTAAAAAALQKVRPDLGLYAWMHDAEERGRLLRSRARAQVVDDDHLLAGRLKAAPRPSLP
jgi:CPA2 family monovalent cation:H+ antiporter-2